MSRPAGSSLGGVGAAVHRAGRGPERTAEPPKEALTTRDKRGGTGPNTEDPACCLNRGPSRTNETPEGKTLPESGALQVH